MSIARARRLRTEANLPELRAWAALRGLRTAGWPVRRQHPIGRDIVDFAIVKARLVIEVDGGIHALPEVRARDDARDQRLKDAGWTVLRISAKEALSADALLDRVRQYLRPPLLLGEGQR